MQKASPAVHTTYMKDPTEIILEIKGLTANPDGTFTLSGVAPVEIPSMVDLIDGLSAQGVEFTLAERLVDEAHHTIARGLLADAIAHRTTRVA